MNLVFGSIFLFLILTPGLIILQFYYSYPFSRKFISYNTFGLSIVPGILLQILFLFYIQGVTNFQINFEIISDIISNSDANRASKALLNIKHFLPEIFFYNLLLWMLALSIGFYCRLIVRVLDLDKKISLLKLNEHWHYVLSGEILKFPTIGKNMRIDFKYIDALVNTSEEDFIYVGVLQDYYVNDEGKVDYIALEYTKRRKLSNDPDNGLDNDSNYYKIPGDLFIIPYANIRNLNIRYIEMKSTSIEKFGFSKPTQIKIMLLLILAHFLVIHIMVSFF